MNNTIYNRKVAVIGCGFVGSTCAFSLMQSSLFSEMVLIDVNTERAEGEAPVSYTHLTLPTIA